MKSINNIAQQNFHLLGNSFSKSDFDLFLNNINHLYTKNQKREIQIIYRGENKSKLFNIYNASDFTSFSHSFFRIGAKGKGYIEKVYSKTEHLKKWDIARVSEDGFIRIFEIINLIIHSINGVVKYNDFYNSNG